MMQGVDAVAQFYDRDTLPEMADKGMNAFMEWWYNPETLDAILARLDKERERIFSAAEKTE